jgi:hypothetical protein
MQVKDSAEKTSCVAQRLTRMPELMGAGDGRESNAEQLLNSATSGPRAGADKTSEPYRRPRGNAEDGQKRKAAKNR